MSNNLKLLWALVIILILTTLYLGLRLSGVTPTFFGGRSYYAVYLESGDIYFGKLHRFPTLRLTDVYLLVQGKDDTGANAFALQRFEDAVWGPNDYIRLNHDNVLWITRLKDKGGAMRAILRENVAQPPRDSLPAPTSEASSSEILE